MVGMRTKIGPGVLWLLLGCMGCSDDGDEAPADGDSQWPDDGGPGHDSGTPPELQDAAADSGAPDSGAPPSGERPQDGRMFTVDEASLAFDALPGVESDRFTGVLGDAGYRIEVPETWNGILVMYAHGYGGTGETLRVTTPPIRPYLLEQGYAWAASSYSRNYYDVRAAVEDTNALALAFTDIAADNGRTLDEPVKRYLIGHSMGGHVTGAAIEAEALDTAMHQVRYAAALPMCGVMGDVELFNYYAAYQLAVHALTDTAVATTPEAFMDVRMDLQDALFSEYPTMTTAAGDELQAIVRNLTGGARPVFELGFATRLWQDAVWGSFGGDGTISGILLESVIDTRMVVYQLDDDPELSEEEQTFNDDVPRAVPEQDANGLRDDGLRWIPAIHGEIDIPVLSMHTLGDLFVPFSMEQIYRRRVSAMGNDDLLVQWAIRGTGHCEFTYAEQVNAFEALVAWEQDGEKPEGDDVLDPALLRDPDYGCSFTDNAFTDAEMEAGTLPSARDAVPACP